MNKSIEDCSNKANPYDNASLVSKASFWWLKDLFKLGLKKPIEQEDLYETAVDHRSKPLRKMFNRYWKDELKKPSPSLLKCFIKAFGVKLVVYGILYNVTDTCAKIFQPQFLGGLLSFFSEGQTEITKTEAYLYGLGIIMCSLIPILAFHPFIFFGFQVGMKLRLVSCSLIYNKALKLTKSVSVDGIAGQVINLMSNDVSRFDFSTGYVNDLFKGPLEMFIFGYFIYREIGAYGLIGIGCLISFMPLQTYMGKKAANFRLSTAKRTDIRVRFMNEIIQGIQVIKMYAWEKSFASVIDKVRRKEIRAIRGSLFIRGTLISFNMVSRLAIFLSLVSYVYFGNIFTARKVFIVTSYFTSLYTSLFHFWPLAITYLAELYVSMQRIQEFLLLPEHKPMLPEDGDVGHETEKLLKNGEAHKPANGLQTNGVNNKEDKALSRRIANRHVTHASILFKNTTADWIIDGKSRQAGIRNIDLDIQPAQLCAITGQVGSGKSTLFQVILGELEVDSGSLIVNGRISYASQEPWLFEGSVRKNITFIEKFDEKRYREVVKVCALERDFDLFPYGDATIVGERGVSLSGGQRARINLARAIYKEADIYLLDDPLSAVDAHVGKHIFEKCIQQFLCDKVVVLATHQLQYLKKCKQVVVFEAGEIAAQGSYKEIKKSDTFSALESALEEEQKVEPEENKEPMQLRKGRQADEKETQITGNVGFDTYKQYFKAVRSWLFIFFVAFLFIGAQTAISSVDYFVAKWVNWEETVSLASVNKTLEASNNTKLALPSNTSFEQPEDAMIARFANMSTAPFEAQEVTEKRNFYIQTYSIAILLVLFLVLQRTFCFFQMCLRASINLHDKLFRGITRATMYFFSTNPSGRILNRFSKDIGAVDTALPTALMDCIVFTVELTAIVTLVTIVNYWLLIPTFVMSLIFYGLRYVYVNTARSVKRLEALTRSPVYSHSNATLQGLSTIRAFRAEEILVNEFDAHQDLNTSAWYLFLATARAFALWLEVTCVIYSASVIFSFLLFATESRGGNVGLAITQCFNLIFICQWGMRQTAELVNQMTSVERVVEYSSLKSEPPMESENKYRPPKDWPQHGGIRFNNLSLRYSANSKDPILKDLSFIVKPKEKIGIVGRTGAGKSSIIQALFRLALNDGTIEIDGIDIGTLGLHDLRSRISIIPQDPIIFSGTLRYNLDPFGQKSDEEIWKALEQVELKSVCRALPGALEFKMSDSGSNFSMGQRQLVCLARAILRNNKILVLDEATANVDPETDKLIQTTIRTQFADCTVLTIAHRLHTVMDSDRVLVMDAGRIVEYAHAYELLQRPGGFLRKLVDQTGPATAALLADHAKSSHKRHREKQ